MIAAGRPLAFALLLGATLATPRALRAQLPGSLGRPIELLLPAAPTSSRVRPFITDDARVVGEGLAQAESWFRLDRETWQQWLLVAIGPTPWLELTVGGVLGEARTVPVDRFSYALPLVQGKALLRRYGGRGPGVAFVGGTFFAGGRGVLNPAGHGTFGFLIATQQFGEHEQLLVHANVGVNHLWINAPDRTVPTWGVGAQLRAVGGLHLVGEVFSGDPYVPGTGAAVQFGVRHFVSPSLQLDATSGVGVAGDVQLPLWTSVGVRLVFPRLFGTPDTAGD